MGNPLSTVDTENGFDSSEELAKLAGVSHGTLDKVREILEKATPEQISALDRDDASISEIYNEIKKGKKN